MLMQMPLTHAFQMRGASLVDNTSDARFSEGLWSRVVALTLMKPLVIFGTIQRLVKAFFGAGAESR